MGHIARMEIDAGFKRCLRGVFRRANSGGWIPRMVLSILGLGGFYYLPLAISLKQMRPRPF